MPIFGRTFSRRNSIPIGARAVVVTERRIKHLQSLNATAVGLVQP
jgi:hypothetical protein